MSQVYEQTGDYMPRTDDGFWHWLQNFSSLLASNPEGYGMTKADASVVTDLFESYTPLWKKCKQPSLRTTSLIQRKDAVKASAMGSCRRYAQLIKHNGGVDEEQMAALGLRIDDTTPTRIPAPSTAPMLTIQAAFVGEHLMRYADETTPASRRKPHGTKFIEIRCNIDAEPNPDESTAVPVGLFTTQPIRLKQEQINAGQTATYIGRWLNTRGEPGPWSLPIAMTIAFGGLVDRKSRKIKLSSDRPATDSNNDLKIAA